MNKFIKTNLKTILAVFATAIICISGTVFATLEYQASQVEYKDGKSVEQALNELYNQYSNYEVVLENGNGGIDALYTIPEGYKELMLIRTYFVSSAGMSDVTTITNYDNCECNQISYKPYYSNSLSFSVSVYKVDNIEENASVTYKNVGDIFIVLGKR